MKKIMGVAALVALGIFMAGSAMAADLVPAPVVNVTATVQSKCTWYAHGALGFTIDPSASGVQSQTSVTQPQVKCTKNKTVAITAVSTGKGGAGVASPLTGALLKQAGRADIPYTFTFASAPVGNGFGAGADLAINIAGSVAEVDAQAAEFAAGSYTDTVTLTIAY